MNWSIEQGTSVTDKNNPIWRVKNTEGWCIASYAFEENIPGEPYYFGVFWYKFQDETTKETTLKFYAHYLDFMAKCLALFDEHDEIHLSIS